MQTVALDGVTDQGLFDEANSDEAPADEAVVEVPEAETEQEEKPETVVVAEKPEAEAEKPVVDDNAPMIPSFRLKQEADARRQAETDLANERAERAALKQRLEALERPAPKVEQPKVEEPDPLLDPKAYREFIREETRQEILNDRREASLLQAHRTYKGEFEEAYAAAQKNLDPVLKMKMQTSRDPGETLIEWHREQKTRAEVGNDPNVFFEKRLEAWLADPANQAKVIERARGGAQPQPGAKPAPLTQLPPSLTRATAAATIDADDDDVSDDGLWKHANA